jgi:hypothetical protein
MSQHARHPESKLAVKQMVQVRGATQSPDTKTMWHSMRIPFEMLQPLFGFRWVFPLILLSVSVAADDSAQLIRDSNSTTQTLQTADVGKDEAPKPIADPESEAAAGDASPAEPGDSNERSPKPPTRLPELLASRLNKATPLNPEQTVFLDVPGRRVILRTEIACTNCVLEMLCVPAGTKEHECILRIQSKAFVVHTALVALGLDPGKPVQYSPEFSPPEGPEIQIRAWWLDADGVLRNTDVRTWIRHNVNKYYSHPLPFPPPGLTLPFLELRYDKFNHELLWFGQMTDQQRDELLSKWDNPDYQKAIRRFHQDGQSRQMNAEFVFVGSQFYSNPDTGEKYYLAEGGYLICLANFADALIDIKENSSASDGAQTYEAWTEHLPPEGTVVLLELLPNTPQPSSDKSSAEKPQSVKPSAVRPPAEKPPTSEDKSPAP